MKSLFIRSFLSLIVTVVLAGMFVDLALAQTSRASCKDSNREYLLAQKKADRLTVEITKTRKALEKIESSRQKSLATLDKRLQTIATQTGKNTANCFIRTGITDIFKGKGDYERCLDRAKKAAEAAAERAAKAKIQIEVQKEKVNSNADSKRAILTQKQARLEGELATQQATAATAKANYDACVASGGGA